MEFWEPIPHCLDHARRGIKRCDKFLVRIEWTGRALLHRLEETHPWRPPVPMDVTIIPLGGDGSQKLELLAKSRQNDRPRRVA
jgi:hypothetical protein